MNAIIYDTETTGTDPDVDKIIQHAMLAVELDEGVLGSVGEVSCRMFSSPVRITYGAMAVHKITEADIVGHGYFDPLQHAPTCEYLIGHKVDFDWRMLGITDEYKRICTLAIARACYPQASSHTLGALYLMHADGAREAISDLENAHDAGADVVLTMRVLRRMIQDFCPSIRTMRDLWLWSEECRIPTTWTFGKWKGSPLGVADRGYMLWYLRQPDPDPYYVTALKRFMGVR